tara:strand:- start:3061 stop:3753 length:693 start_codon:yes stop_codon:yes gene_type:complete
MIKSSTKLSVIMSVYNAQETIKKSIKSILDQSYKEFEFLILDDASTDETFNICNEFKKEDKRIKLYRNDKNLGLTKSLNKLIAYSNGEIIARQDSDDVSKKERLQKQINYLYENNLDACTSRANIMDEKKVIPRLSFLLPKKIVIRYKNPFIHGTLLIRKSVLEENNFYDENFYYSQDYKLMSDLIKKNKKIKIMNENLYYLNMKNNISNLKKEEQNYYAKCVRKNISPL